MTNLVQAAIDRVQQLPPEKKQSVLANYPTVSSNQTALWYEMQINPLSTAYNLGVLWEWESGTRDLASLETAILGVVERNRILRSVFFPHEDDVYLLTLSPENSVIEYFDFDSEESMIERLQEIYATPFDLTSAYPARFYLCRVDEKQYLAGFFHHIVMDGVSIASLRAQLCQLLEEPERSSHLIDYVDYLFSNSAPLEDGSKLWNEYYQGFESEWLTFSDPAQPSFKGAQFVERAFDGWPRLADFTRENGLQTFTLLHHALAKTVHQLTGGYEFFVATTDQNRPVMELQETIGYFARTIKLKTRYSTLDTLPALRQFETENLQALSLPALSLHEVQQQARCVEMMQPYQLVLELQRIEDADQRTLKSTRLGQRSFKRAAKNDLSIFFYINGNQASISIEYNSDVYSASLVQRFMDCYHASLNAYTDVKCPAKPAFVYGDACEPVDVLDRLSQHISTASEQAAFLNEGTISYAQLAEQVEVLSGVINLNYNQDETVVVLAERTPSTLMALYAAWLTGRKGLLLPSDLPAARVAQMCEEVGARQLLSSASANDRKVYAGLTVLGTTEFTVNHEQRQYQPVPNDFGYVIYSSGSTGKPKGVNVTRASISNLATFLDDCYQGIERCALNADFSFDAAYQHLLMPLLGRAVYVLTKEERLDVGALKRVLKEHRIQSMDCTPSQLRLFFDAQLFEDLPDFKLMLVGGEKIDQTLLNEIARLPDIRFLNVYGPCECTVDVTCANLNEHSQEGELGQPITNTSIGIYTPEGKLCDVGETGEIVIFGAPVSQGYLSEDENHAFRDFVTLDGLSRGYATGDRGHIDASHGLWIAGRADNQVKVNGVRIELDELVSVAMQSTSVSRAYAVFDPDMKEIALFCSPKKKASELCEEQILTHMAKYLPSYMLPAQVHFMTTLPLTTSGKVDVQYLLEALKLSSKHCASERPSHLEPLAVVIERAALLSITSPDTNLLNAGLNSLKIFKVIRAIHEHYGVVLSIGDIIVNPTLTRLYELIQTKRDTLVEAKKGLMLLKTPRRTTSSRLVLFPPVGGGLNAYHSLIDKICPDIKVMGAEDDFDALTKAVNSFEQLCDHYADQVKREGVTPVDLAGWSYGGLLAFEVARKLRMSGFQVETVTLIDSLYTGQMVLPNNEQERILQSVVGGLIGSLKGAEDLVASMRVDTFGIVKILNKEYGIPISNSELSTLAKRVGWHRQLLANHSFSISPSPDFQIRSVWAKESKHSLTQDCIRWHTLNRKGGSEITLPGDHYSIIQQPILATILSGRDIKKEINA
ncbi:AMP-binding protein [Vibrio coralliilyticus]|uniref:AMP-binding protein n=1 Tax=Vibrio coralliilyticus TaxID=190893 RepID=A0AAP7DER2_9VIBR|nr:AMP-binding protein [Vibrio coralliilyticus]